MYYRKYKIDTYLMKMQKRCKSSHHQNKI